MRRKRQKLLINEIEDRLLKQNFQNLEDFLSVEPVTNAQWRFVELTFTQNQAPFLFRHGLQFTPLDIIQTSLKGTGSVTYNYVDFNGETISMTVAGTDPNDPLVVRLLIGRLS